MESSTSDLVFSGIALMVLGMSIVYLFLALLVVVINTTAKLLQRFAPEPPPSAPYASPVSPSVGGVEADAELVAVIAAAVQRYENK